MSKTPLAKFAAKETILTKKACDVLRSAHNSVKNFIDIYDDKTRLRGRGAPTDEDQDLLRSALLFSGAGVDSCLKYLLKNCLEVAIERSSDARSQFVKHCERAFRAESVEALSKDLAKLLSSKSPRDEMISRYLNHLISGSLQSVQQLSKVAEALGCRGPKYEALEAMFQARNEITHEMDVDFDHPTRNRRTRKRNDVVRMCNDVLSEAARLIDEASKFASTEQVRHQTLQYAKQAER